MKTVIMKFPAALEQILLRYLKTSFYQGTKRARFIEKEFSEADLKFFAKGAVELSRLFTVSRQELKTGYLNRPPLRAGYLLYFLPLNFAKNLGVLSQLPQAYWQRKSFRVLDLGAGPGSASLAFLTRLHTYCPQAKVELHLVDQQEKGLADARQLISEYAKIGLPQAKIHLHTHPQHFSRYQPQGSFDLILISHALNEWVRKNALERAEWLAPLLNQHLAETGVFVITEPALKRPTRELMALRDHLVAHTELSMLAPCRHDQPCPMLAATKQDWCHFYFDWGEPEFLQKVDRWLKNDNRFLKASFLLMAKEEFYPRSQDFNSTYRMISNRMATKGKTEVVLCGSPGRIRVTRLDKDRSRVNSDLDQLRRGDLVQLSGKKWQDYEMDRRLRLGRQDSLKKI